MILQELFNIFFRLHILHFSHQLIQNKHGCVIDFSLTPILGFLMTRHAQPLVEPKRKPIKLQQCHGNYFILTLQDRMTSSICLFFDHEMSLGFGVSYCDEQFNENSKHSYIPALPASPGHVSFYVPISKDDVCISLLL